MFYLTWMTEDGKVVARSEHGSFDAACHAADQQPAEVLERYVLTIEAA